MDDLAYILGLGFTPADAARAISIALFCSLFMRQYVESWRFAAIAFSTDRVWAIVSMAFAGHDAGAVASAFFANIMAIPSDLGIYAVRFVGIFLAVSVGFGLRSTLHRRWAEA